MADLAISVPTMGPGVAGLTIANEAITAGDWLYAVSSTASGVAISTDLTKANVIGMALRGASSGQYVAYAKSGDIVDVTVATVKGETYLLADTAGGGATHPVADVVTGEYVTRVAYGLGGSSLLLSIEATGIDHA